MVAAAAVIGRKVAIRPKRQDDWAVVPNLCTWRTPWVGHSTRGGGACRYVMNWQLSRCRHTRFLRVVIQPELGATLGTRPAHALGVASPHVDPLLGDLQFHRADRPRLS
jgi:hypothetical protein